MKTINFAVKWWLDILVGKTDKERIAQDIEDLEEKIKYFISEAEGVEKELEKPDVAQDAELQKLGQNLLEMANSYVEHLFQQRNFLMQKMDMINELCEYVKPERREEVEKDFSDFIAEEMHKDKDKCVYLFTDEEGVARLTLAVFCRKENIRNDNTVFSPLPPKFEMWITPWAVDVRYDEEAGYIRLFEDKTQKRER